MIALGGSQISDARALVSGHAAVRADTDSKRMETQARFPPGPNRCVTRLEGNAPPLPPQRSWRHEPPRHRHKPLSTAVQMQTTALLSQTQPPTPTHPTRAWKRRRVSLQAPTDASPDWWVMRRHCHRSDHGDMSHRAIATSHWIPLLKRRQQLSCRRRSHRRRHTLLAHGNAGAFPSKPQPMHHPIGGQCAAIATAAIIAT